MSYSLALGGGGAKGLAHIEFLKALDEFGIKPKAIAGTSMGAIIGAMYASGISGKELEEIALKINKRAIVTFTDLSFNNKSLIKGRKIISWIDKQLGGKKFSDLEIPLKVIVTNLSTGEQEVITKGKVIDAIRASIAIPGIFSPVKRNDKLYVDGGVLNQVPYDILDGKIIAIDVTSKAKVPKDVNAYENLMYSFYIMRKHLDHAKNQPELYYELSLPKIGLLDFHKYAEVKTSVADDIKKFKKDLIN